MRNHMKAPIEGIETYSLILETRHHLDLLQTLYIPSVSRNFISLSRLDVSGFDLSLDMYGSIYIRMLFLWLWCMVYIIETR